MASWQWIATYLSSPSHSAGKKHTVIAIFDKNEILSNTVYHLQMQPGPDTVYKD